MNAKEIARCASLEALMSFQDDRSVRQAVKLIPLELLRQHHGIEDINNLTTAQIKDVREKMMFGFMIAQGKLERRVVRELNKPQDQEDAIESGIMKFAHAKGICRNPSCDKKALEESFRNETVLKMMFCGKCRIAGYCSKDCQRAHWPEHKTVCRLAPKKD